MKKYIPQIFILTLFLSSCSRDVEVQVKKEITLSNQPQIEEIKVEDPEPSKPVSKDLLLSQTKEETSLNYNGKVIKKWSHTPPEKVPFIWDEACSVVWKQFEKLTGEDAGSYEAKQKIWSKLSVAEKEECLKERFAQSIKTEYFNDRFIQISESGYEGSLLWIYDTETGGTQKIGSDGIIKSIIVTSTGIDVTIENSRGDEQFTVFKFDKQFNKLK